MSRAVKKSKSKAKKSESNPKSQIIEKENSENIDNAAGIVENEVKAELEQKTEQNVDQNIEENTEKEKIELEPKGENEEKIEEHQNNEKKESSDLKNSTDEKPKIEEILTPTEEPEKKPKKTSTKKTKANSKPKKRASKPVKTSETPAQKKPDEPEYVYTFKISLLDHLPRIWRRFKVDSKITLGELHYMICCFMGWQGSHNYGFENGDNFKYVGELPKTITLEELNLTKGSTLAYLYDYGDSWEHRIKLEKISRKMSREEVPICLNGERACPPENCGGISGLKALNDALKSGKGPEYEEFMNWFEDLGITFNPERFDLNAINNDIEKWLKIAKIQKT